MMRLPRFHYLAPASLAEAARALADAGPSAMVLAGGTDLFPNMKRRPARCLSTIDSALSARGRMKASAAGCGSGVRE